MIRFELVAERHPRFTDRMRVLIYQLHANYARDRILDIAESPTIEGSVDALLEHLPKVAVSMIGIRNQEGYMEQVQEFKFAEALKSRYFPLITPIERVAKVLDAAGMPRGDVLVPEQCAQVFIDGKWYHLVLQEMPE